MDLMAAAAAKVTGGASSAGSNANILARLEAAERQNALLKKQMKSMQWMSMMRRMLHSRRRAVSGRRGDWRQRRSRPNLRAFGGLGSVWAYRGQHAVG